MIIRDVYYVFVAVCLFLFVINFPPSCSSPCRENPRGEEVCDVYGE
jgi:hypothetical protein